jgi:hypothetical protein
VAVGDVDVAADPEAGVGDPQARRPEPLVDQRRGTRGRAGALLEPEPLAVGKRELVEQRLGEAVVVVAGDNHDLALAERFSQLGEERACRRQRRADREVAQLDRVAEEDDAVGAADLLEQRAPDLGMAQHVLAAGGAEVEVGDDRRAHRGLLLHLSPLHICGG